MIHEMKLRDIYFNKIKSGKKIYETRLNDDKRKQIKIGDIIVFKNNSNLDDCMQTKVEDLIYFNSFLEMLNVLPKEEVGFENETISEIANIYRQFYSEAEEKQFGVLAIKVKLANESPF